MRDLACIGKSPGIPVEAFGMEAGLVPPIIVGLVYTLFAGLGVYSRYTQLTTSFSCIFAWDETVNK